MTQLEAMEGRVTELDVQIREFKAQGQIALTYKDIMVRYGVQETKARAILRGIRSVCGGGKLGQGRVLPSEVVYWESLIDKRMVRL
jgi:hypothetical protein